MRRKIRCDCKLKGLPEAQRVKVENWLFREVLRHWRREMKKKVHVSYLPMLVEKKVPPLPHCVAEREKTKQNGGKQSSMSPPLSGSLPAQSLRGERDRRPRRLLTTKQCSPTQN